MKKILLICAVVLGFTYSASAQVGGASVAPSPHLVAGGEFKFTEEKHDFGKIPQGTPVTTVFEFTNVGNAPLILTEVKPTCGCTVADYTKTPVAPNAKGSIKITYDAAAASAGFNKTIVVSSNSKTPTKYLNIVGEVVAKPAASSK